MPVNSLKPIKHARADDEVVEAGGGAGGEVTAFDVDFDGQIGERLDAEAAGAAMDDVLADSVVAPEALVADVAFDVGVEESILVVERAENPVGDVIVRVEKSAVTLLVEIEETEAVADGDPRRKIDRVLGNEL